MKSCLCRLVFSGLVLPWSLLIVPCQRLPAQSVVINEFLAINDSGRQDEDGDFSDWIEFFNNGNGPVDLGGWYLTQDPLDLTRFQLPQVILDPGGFLVVVASGKDRIPSPGEEGEIHTDFRLDGEGEYLALVRPDGETIEDELSPAFPPQVADVSFGLAGVVDVLVPAGSAGEYLIPSDGSLGLDWIDSGFSPGMAWTAADTGLGYHTGAAAGAFPPPLSYWPLDGDSDDAVGPNHGIVHGSAAASFTIGFDGTVGGAIDLDGTDDYIEIESHSSLPLFNQPAFTIAMWVRGLPQADNRVWSEGSSGNNNPLFTLGTENSVGTGKLDFYCRDAEGNTIVNHRHSEGVVFDGTWHHIVWVDDGGDARLYIDGILDGQDFSYPRVNLPLDVTAIGGVLRASACCTFDGELDDVAVWNLALTEGEVENLAGGQHPGEGSSYGSLVATDVESGLRGTNSSLYLRLPFAVDDPGLYDALLLRMQYDDGFVAYLNGVEIAWRNAPDIVSWDSVATESHQGAVAVAAEAINVSAGVGLLVPGENVLAIHGLNIEAGDDTFLLRPELVASGALGTEWHYFLEPSPGGPNQGGTVDFVEDTKFSVDRGFYDSPFQVEITTLTEGAEIRYTIDGSAPSETHGEIYAGPITVETTTTLRAMAHLDGYVSTNVDTQTYIFLDDVIRQPSLPAGYPATWAGYPADYEMDPEICTDTSSPHYASTIRGDLLSIPTVSLVLDRDDLMGPTRGIYTHPLERGVAWERPASMELIWPDGVTSGFQLNCGARMQGGSSARPYESKHSFRLLFKDIHGPPKLRYPVFPDSRVDEFDTLILRCCSTDSWHFKDGGSRYRRWDSQFIRDQWMRDSQLDLGHISSHGVYVHLYVNGLYWGLYNLAERPDDSFQSSYQGDMDEDWDIVKDFNELFRGNRDSWNALMGMARSGLGSDAAYQRVQGNSPDGTPNPAYPVLLDVDNLIDYMMLHLFAGAEDWPHHNWYGARSRTGNLGGWRFFVWDQEIVLDFAYRDRINVSNDNSPAIVYSSLRANPEFRMRFADRVRRHFYHGGALTVEQCRQRWMERATEIDRAVICESARWGDFREDHPDPSNSPAELYTREGHWLVEQEKVLNTYLPESHRLALLRFRDADLYPGIDPPLFSQHGGVIPPGFELDISSEAGSVYFTLDGTDPRLPGGSVSPDALTLGGAATATLLSAGAEAKIRIPTSTDPGPGWMDPGFDDTGWLAGPTGVGYERASGYEGEISTDVESEIYGNTGSLYLRLGFDVEDPGEFNLLLLRMKYDDGFVAYLNGREVARSNAPGSLDWNSLATDSPADAQALVFQSFDISEHVDSLRTGANVLAIHGLNASTTSSDLLIVPELAAGSSSTSGITLDRTTHVKARRFDGGEWSALEEAVFLLDRPLPLRITEIMFHPPDPPPGSPFSDNDFEFVELQNVGTEPMALTGARFTRGITFEFPLDEVVELAPGEVVVLVEDLEAFEERYDTSGIFVGGEYEGRFNNGGEFVTLEDALGRVILDFAYDDMWYPSTDGNGSSLEVVDALAPPDSWIRRSQWQASRDFLGTPGVHENSTPVGGFQIVGDANQDGDLDISDPIAILGHLFLGSGFELPCDGATLADGGNRTLFDFNGDSQVDLSDPIGILSFLFTAGPPPALGSGCQRMEGCPDACTP